MKLDAQDIKVLASSRVKRSIKKQTDRIMIVTMVVGGLGFGTQIYAPSYTLIGAGVGCLALLGMFWYTSKVDKKVKAYTAQLMTEWRHDETANR